MREERGRHGAEGGRGVCMVLNDGAVACTAAECH